MHRSSLRLLTVAALAILTISACRGARGARSPEALRDAYAQALKRDDPDAAYALLSPELQARTPRAEFRTRWKAQAGERAATQTALTDLPKAQHMKYGAIIVDMAAESGGNCELTQPGEHVIANDVNIHGPLNLPSRMPTHASELYAKNLYNFLSPWIKDGNLAFDWEDDVVAGTILCREGATVHATVKQVLGEN